MDSPGLWVPYTGLSLLALYVLCTAHQCYHNFFASPVRFLSDRFWILARTGCLFLTLALIFYAMLGDCFWVRYVFEHSHTKLQWWYQCAGVWNAHEGSFFLFCLCLHFWELWLRRWPISIQTISIHQLITLSSFIFLISVSNLFEPILWMNPPTQGQNLNPLLQDIGLAMHPPCLFLGYSGVTVPFALAISMLIQRKASLTHLACIQYFSLLSLSFLTVGIALGSWWSYRVLGWGGWWFWDPVENVSLIVWIGLLLTCHAWLPYSKSKNHTSISNRSDQLDTMAWPITAILITFACMWIGSWVVRAGLLQSVHSFAKDMHRGLWMMAFMVPGFLISLYVYIKNIKFFSRAHLISGSIQIISDSATKQSMGLFSSAVYSHFSTARLLFMHQVVGIVIWIIIFAGTAMPFILEYGWNIKKKISPDYFNEWCGALVFFLILCIPFIGRKHPMTHSTLLTGCLAWIMIGIGIMLWIDPIAYEHHTLSAWSIPFIGAALMMQWPCRSYGIYFSHAGFLILSLGIALHAIGSKTFNGIAQTHTQPWNQQLHVRVHPEPTKILETGAQMTQVKVECRINQKTYYFEPDQVFYPDQKTTIRHPSIVFDGWNDIYVSLGGEIKPGHWLVRIWMKPGIRLIWFGALMMAMGIYLMARSYLEKNEPCNPLKEYSI